MNAIRARLAHMGIFVRDREKMVNFYTEVLGLMVTDQGPGRAPGMHLTFMSADPGEHHQVVLVTGRPPNETGDMTTTCLQNVLVLSAGQVMQPDAAGRAMPSATVTLHSSIMQPTSRFPFTTCTVRLCCTMLPGLVVSNVLHWMKSVPL